jgi:hypothetical protein
MATGAAAMGAGMGTGGAKQLPGKKHFKFDSACRIAERAVGAGQKSPSASDQA